MEKASGFVVYTTCKDIQTICSVVPDYFETEEERKAAWNFALSNVNLALCEQEYGETMLDFRIRVEKLAEEYRQNVVKCSATS